MGGKSGCGSFFLQLEKVRLHNTSRKTAKIIFIMYLFKNLFFEIKSYIRNVNHFTISIEHFTRESSSIMSIMYSFHNFKCKKVVLISFIMIRMCRHCSAIFITSKGRLMWIVFRIKNTYTFLIFNHYIKSPSWIFMTYLYI